jgi:hypothetical protein
VALDRLNMIVNLTIMLLSLLDLPHQRLELAAAYSGIEQLLHFGFAALDDHS